MNDTPASSKEEIDAKVKDLETMFNPIMMRVYQEAGGAPGGMPGMGGMPGAGGMPNFPGGQPTGNPTSGTSQTNVDDVD